MRQALYSGLEGLIAAAGYSLLVDFVRPALQGHYVVLWWLTLGLYVGLLLLYGCRRILVRKPVLVATGFLLLAASAYLYDPTIQPRLASMGLGWLWAVTLASFFLWIFVLVKRVRKGRRRECSG